MRPPLARRTLVRMLSWTLLVFGGYATVCGLLWSRQEQLLFLRTAESKEPTSAALARIELSVEDGLVLRGWHRPAARSSARSRAASPLIIYFAGNNEDVKAVVDQMVLPPGWQAVAMGYRGYGASDGIPSTEGFLRDALAIFDYAVELPGVDRGRVVVMGRSLGTGVAVSVAARRPVAGTVLVSPYDSLVRVAWDLYPWLPVPWLMRHQIAASEYAPQAKSPLLTVVGSQDAIISPERSKALYEAWQGPKQWQTLEGIGHSFIYGRNDFWERFTEFLEATTQIGSPVADSTADTPRRTRPVTRGAGSRAL